MNIKYIIRLAAGVGLLTILIGGSLAWYVLVGPGYYAEVNAVRKELEKIPHVEIIDLDYVEDITIEHISARIIVANKLEMVFSGLNKASFSDGNNVNLNKVGPYRFRYRGEGYVGVIKAATGTPVRSEFAGGAISIGRNGDFAHLFPFAIPNIQTAVARCDDILEIIGYWPETPSPPQYFKNPKGTEFYYWVTSKDIDGQDDSLWMQPYSALRTNSNHPKID
jgi:hypothetical protein